MKKALFRMTMTGMLALAFLAANQPLRAQERLVANIPFAFTVGKVTLPAGEYRVQKCTSDSAMLLIHATDRNEATFAISNAVATNKPQPQSKLVFHRHGDSYFLYQIWRAGESRGRELPPSAKEKEQGLLAHSERPDQVTIVASLVAPKP